MLKFLFLMLTCFVQLISNAQNLVISSDRLEKSCPQMAFDKNLYVNTNGGIVLIRAVLNLNGEVIAHEVVYSSVDEQLAVIATGNIKNCLFEIETSDKRNSSVVKAYKWNNSKTKGVTLHSEQILRVDKECPRPEYPEISKRREQEGRVDLSFQLDGQDYVSAVKVTKSSGFTELDTQAIVHLVGCKRKTSNGGKKRQTTFYTWSLH